MLRFPDISPNIIEIGPIQLRWYGLMYAVGFIVAYILIKRQQRAQQLGLTGGRLQDLIFFLALGLIIGARLGYILFYQYPNLMDYLRHPLEIIAFWHGGMSFHGGLIGSLLAGLLFCRMRQLPFWKAADTVIVTAPIGLGLGRIGNFINGELIGRPSSLPWAMIFPSGGPLPRHPSQLYEALFEGLVLFIFLWRIKDSDSRPGSMVCAFLGGYGILRFMMEFFREPDPQLGLLLGPFSMGQILCMIMMICAFLLWIILPQNENKS